MQSKGTNQRSIYPEKDQFPDMTRAGASFQKEWLEMVNERYELIQADPAKVLAE